MHGEQMMAAPVRIDSHVHILGDGSSGSGCWLRLKKRYHKFLARLILRELELPSHALTTGLDALYVEKLSKMVRESSLTAAIILAHERVYDDAGNPREDLGSFYTPNEYVLSIARSNPDCFIPAVSIHPGRRDALDELERCIEHGAAMLKLLPNCQNVNCSDNRYRKFWERLAAAHIPFLAHTGGELSVPVVSPAYADPATLALPLECGVSVIAAHGGTRALFWDAHYTPAFVRMLERFPNLYADNSGMNTPIRAAYFKDLLAPAVQERIIQGSDLPIPISPAWTFLRGRISLQAWQAARAERNPLERDLLIKQALGFTPATFSRVLSLIPPGVAAKFSQNH